MVGNDINGNPVFMAYYAGSEIESGFTTSVQKGRFLLCTFFIGLLEKIFSLVSALYFCWP